MLLSPVRVQIHSRGVRPEPVRSGVNLLPGVRPLKLLARLRAPQDAGLILPVEPWMYLFD